ncbi:ketopantoate reductase family protein [Candidatus Omnitrophota bacterium]
MKTGVIGCGAIGGLFLGYLRAQGEDVYGVVRDYQKEPLLKDGLCIEGPRGPQWHKVEVDTRLTRPVDLAVFATKINDLEAALQDNIDFLKDAVVLTTQNGIEADAIVRKYFPPEKILTAIVMFGATFYPPNKVVHNFEGELIVGNIFGAAVDGREQINQTLGKAFNLKEELQIKGAKYLKVFINLNNCIPAALGISMQEAFADLDTAGLAIDLNREAYQIVEKSGIELTSLPTYPKERLSGLVAMDRAQAAGLFSKIMTSLSDRPLYGSILQSIKRGKRSEIDYINGQIVRLAQEAGWDAGLNRKMVELVHRVEDSKKFLARQELLSINN